MLLLELERHALELFDSNLFVLEFWVDWPDMVGMERIRLSCHPER